MPRTRKTWWQRLAFTTTRNAPPAKQVRRRPNLEVLEDRAVPSTNPIANHDAIDTDGTNPVVVNVLDNDTAAKGIDRHSVVIKDQAPGGNVRVNSKTGAITYVAKASTSGTDTFTYKFKDKKGNWSNKATVSIVVNRPTANDDFADTDGTNPVVIDVLANDTDPDGPLNVGSVTIVTPPTHGSVSVNPTGEVTYTPLARFDGTDSFTYFILDEAGARSNIAKVTIIVHQPKANDDFATTPAGQKVTIPVLANDHDPDGALLPESATIVKPPSHGSATVNPSTGAIDYTPASGFVGTDTLKYVVADEHGATSDPATVTIVVTQDGGMNDDVIDTDASVPVQIAVMDNDFNGTGLNRGTLRIVTPPQHGKVTVDRTTGIVTYQSTTPGWGGTDRFIYAVDKKITLQTGPETKDGTVIVVVNHPTANDDFADTDGTNPVVLDVLANDTDPDGALDPSSVTLAGGPSKGFVAIDPVTGAITYTPRPGMRGTDTFRYFMADEAGARSNTATVTVIINQPTANDDFAFTNKETPVDIAILANDTDPDGALDPASVVLAAGPKHGSIAFDATGIAHYTPAAGFFGTDTFFYQVSDVHGAQSNVARVTVVVLAT